MRFGDMLGVGGNRHLIEPHLRAFLGDDVVHDDALIGLGGAVAGLEDVARPADRQADVAVGERVDVFGGVELADIGPDLQQRFLDLGEVLRRLVLSGSRPRYFSVVGMRSVGKSST